MKAISATAGNCFLIQIITKHNKYLPTFYTCSPFFHRFLTKMEGFRANDPHFATKALHEGQEPEQWNSMAVVPPISLSTTFKQFAPADFKM